MRHEARRAKLESRGCSRCRLGRRRTKRCRCHRSRPTLRRTCQRSWACSKRRSAKQKGGKVKQRQGETGYAHCRLGRHRKWKHCTFHHNHSTRNRTCPHNQVCNRCRSENIERKRRRGWLCRVKAQKGRTLQTSPLPQVEALHVPPQPSEAPPHLPAQLGVQQVPLCEQRQGNDE